MHAVIFGAQHELRRNVPAQPYSNILGKTPMGRQPIRSSPFFSFGVVAVYIQNVVPNDCFPFRREPIDTLEVIAFSPEIQIEGPCTEIFIFKMAERVFRSETPALRVVLGGENEGRKTN